MKMEAEKAVPMKFPKGNMILYFQDMQYWEGVTHEVVFYPKDYYGGKVTFIGDGYGITHNNKLGLTGTYGNGFIGVAYTRLPDEIKSIIYPLFEKEILRYSASVKIAAMKKMFEELVDTNVEEAERILSQINKIIPPNPL